MRISLFVLYCPEWCGCVVDYISECTGLSCCLKLRPEAETLPLVDGSNRVGVKV